MNCQCQNCLPKCGTLSTATCPDSIRQGAAILAVDDNCDTRILSGSGIPHSENGSVQLTDGSNEKGHIKLNPPASMGAKGILATLANGSLVDLGEDAPDGHVLIRQGGVWASVPKTEGSLSFDNADIGSYNTKLAAWGCGAGGKNRLGFFDNCPNSLIILDENSSPVCLSLKDLAAKLLEPLCQAAPDWNGADCINAVLVCTPEGVRKVKPIGGKVLYGNKNNASCWSLTDLDPIPTSGLKLVFKYTGAVQYFTVPPDVGFMTIKAWGAGGSWDYAGAAARGGLGGYTSVKFAVIPGQTYAVIVGQGGSDVNGAIFGFGGRRSPDGHQQNGGGLSGVFSGNTDVAPTDSARAIAIAGGGGCGAATNPNQNMQYGFSGNAANSGGQATMQGINATSGQVSGLGAGGGGYTGGGHTTRRGFGGAGFTHALGTLSSIQFFDDTSGGDVNSLPPNSTDPDWETAYGAGKSNRPGLVVVNFTAA